MLVSEIDTAPAKIARRDNAMVMAIARRFRWREMLENGTYATIAEIAGAERINRSYICRVLLLSLLAPHIVEAILTGKQASCLRLDRLMKRLQVQWEKQQDVFSS